jgi:hypothetical protein
MDNDIKKIYMNNESFIIFKNKKIHCETGPAIVSQSGIYWYIDGVNMSEETWKSTLKISQEELENIKKPYIELYKQLCVINLLKRKTF